VQRLRIFLVFLVVGLSFFFNIERLDFGEENIINIASFVYVIGFGAVVITIALPQVQYIKRWVVMVFWGVVYLLAKILIFNQRPAVGGVYTYLSISELAMLLALVWMAYQVTGVTQSFENAVEKITIGGTEGAYVKSLVEADEDIRREMFRSRHYRHPLGVIAVQPNLNDATPEAFAIIREAQTAMVHSYIVNNMANTLRKFLRPTDIVLEDRKTQRVYVICPETSPKNLKVLLEYVQDVTADEMGVGAKYGFATFPDEAVVFEDLLEKSVERLQSQTQSNQLENL